MAGIFRTTVLCLFLSATLSAQHVDEPPIAIVNGEPIFMHQVEAAAADELAGLEQRRAQFEMEMKREKQAVFDNTLDGLLMRRALAAEAEKRKVSVDDLIEIEVNSVVPQPTDEAIVQFYSANKSGLQGSLGDNVVAIRAYLRDERRQAVMAKFVDRLKKDYGAVSYLEPQRFVIPIDGRPSKGPMDAPVTIVEFSDFECPFCRALLPALQQVVVDYKDKVRVVYLQFPLADIHKQALKAAEASLCALEQDKFWQMHDAMFADQANLSVEALKEKASGLSMDRKAFDTCLDSGRHFADVRKDVGEGAKAGVTGTPALFINGRFLVGNQPYNEIRKIIEDELRRTSDTGH